MSASRTLLVIATAFGATLSTPPVVRASFPHAGTTARARVATSNARIKAKVRAALDADTRLRGSGVFVQSVDDGVVVLAGTARTMSDHLRATGDAARVPGVRRVANAVEVKDLLADEESRSQNDHGTPASARRAWPTSATEARVLADSPTPGLRLVNVDTHDGAVTLFGTVPPARVEAAVEKSARKMSAVKARDHDLEREVSEALEVHPELTDARIDVGVKRGVVRLTGTVPTPAQRRTAALTAGAVSGVKSVRDALRVSGR
jgi:osmotically-inducible protein OsmY